MARLIPIAALALLTACAEPTPEARRVEVCQKGGEIAATVIAQELIERTLRAPSTAKHPWGNSAKWLGECEFRVASYVDAQNAFGGTVRTAYSMVVTYSPDDQSWTGREFVVN